MVATVLEVAADGVLPPVALAGGVVAGFAGRRAPSAERALSPSTLARSIACLASSSPALPGRLVLAAADASTEMPPWRFRVSTTCAPGEASAAAVVVGGTAGLSQTSVLNLSAIMAIVAA